MIIGTLFIVLFLLEQVIFGARLSWLIGDAMFANIFFTLANSKEVKNEKRLA